MKIRYSGILFLMMLGIFTSCNWMSNQISPDCLGSRPDVADLNILLTHNDLHDTTLIVIYKGDIEDEQVVDSFDVWSETLTVSLPVDEYYSAKAFYMLNNQEYIAVDGDELKASNNPDDYGDCWLISGDKLFVQIMYP